MVQINLTKEQFVPCVVPWSGIFGRPVLHGLLCSGYVRGPGTWGKFGFSAMNATKVCEAYIASLNVQSQDLDAHVLERNGYTCQMCGAAAGDPDPLGGTRNVRLTMGHIIDKSKGGDDSPQNLRAVCTNCNEGLQNTSLPKPNRIHLLAQVRRATIQDQRALLDWMLQKFNLKATEKHTKEIE